MTLFLEIIMETLGKWLIAGAVLCVLGYIGLKDEKNAGQARIFLLVLCLILGIVGYNCLSPKEQTYPENDSYGRMPSHNSHGEDVPFGNNQDVFVFLYSCSAYKANGDFACKVDIKSKKGILYAFPDGGTRGYRIENAPYDAPGAYYIYWGNEPIYF